VSPVEIPFFGEDIRFFFLTLPLDFFFVCVSVLARISQTLSFLISLYHLPNTSPFFFLDEGY
jgi:hypothetical protein